MSVFCGIQSKALEKSMATVVVRASGGGGGVALAETSCYGGG